MSTLPKKKSTTKRRKIRSMRIVVKLCKTRKQKFNTTRD